MVTPDITQDISGMRIIDMTAGQLADFLASTLRRVPTTPDYVYGISGLAKLLGCSEATAWRKKKSGIFDEAISQVDDTIIVDTKKVLDILRMKKVQ